MKQSLFTFLFSFCSFLQALPSSGELVQGEASISAAHSKAVTVEAHGKAVINWDKFGIKLGESVTFTQSQPKMAILNRVTGGEISKLLGNLNANCPIYLINGKGIFIGGDAQITTAGFIASTADISNESFLGQKNFVFQHLKEGEIVNFGNISSTEGNVVLIARSIKNAGEIYAPQGQVTLTTTEIIIHPNEKKQVFIRPKMSLFRDEKIDNQGVIEAHAIYLETLSPYALAINHTGIMKTFSIAEENGRIFLTAHQGGAELRGELKAPAGIIEIAAEKITAQNEAIFETSSDYNGGAIALKGIKAVQVDKGAKLLANSQLEGDGGGITIWSQEKTFFDGEAQARGGYFGGNGGKIDISTQGEYYRVVGKVDTYAPKGQRGLISFDPKFVFIQPDGTDSASGNTFSSIPSDTANISGQTLQEALNSGNVTIQANTDIGFNDTVDVTGGGSALTLQAGRSILFSGELTLNGGDFTAIINDSGAISADRDSGRAIFSMYSLDSLTFSKLITQGGNVSVDVGTFGGRQEGEIFLSEGIIDAGGGNISLVGFGRMDGSNDALGIIISNYAQIKTIGSGAITYQGKGGNGSNGCHGICLSDNTTMTQSENGRIYLLGVGGGDGFGSMNSGVIHAGSIESTGSGAIDIEGTATGGIDLNTGVCFVSRGCAKVVDGNLTLNGIGKGTRNQNYGIRFESASHCSSSGIGQIQLVGSSSSGQHNNHGVILSNGMIDSNIGAISIQGSGQGSGNYNYGVRLETMASITSNDTATITIQGNNFSGLTSNVGVSFSSNKNVISSKNGDISIIGSSLGTGQWNEGFRLDGGGIYSTGIGANAASISIEGTGSPNGTDCCTGVDIRGYQVRVTSIDGNITIHGIASGENASYEIYPDKIVSTTGSGMITYIEN